MKNEQFDVDEAAEQIRALVRERRFEEAIGQSRTNIATWPTSIRDQAWHFLAYVLWCAGQNWDAIGAITAAIDLKPRDPAHRDARARWALELRDFKTTIEDCTILLEIEKERQSEAFVDAAYVLRAFSLIHTNEREMAENDLSAVHSAGPFRIWRRNWTKAELLKLDRDTH